MSISTDCKLFKDCPFNWDCLLEIALHGDTGPWSLELCYDMAALIIQGLISVKGGPQGIIEQRIHFGMLGTFYGPITVGNENRTVGSEKSTITNENSSLTNQEIKKENQK